MVAIPNKAAYTTGWHFGIFLCQIHRNLSRNNILALSAFTINLGGRHIVVNAHFLQNIIDS